VRLAETHSAYANVSSAFETPTATELGNHPDGSAGINQDLRPQRSTTSETGIRGFFGTVLSYDVAAYVTKVKDELVPFEIPNSNGRRYFRNAGRTMRRGAEVGTQLSIGALSWTGAYTLSSFRFDSYRTGGAVYDGNVIPGVPRNRWQSSLRASSGHAFAVLEGEGGGSVFLDDANSVKGPGYTVANVRVGSSFPIKTSALAVSAGIQNIFDRHYASSIAINAARGKFFEPAATRSFFVGMSLSDARPHS
jgi:Outer membrane receptor proteins, mostly Fe transport